MGPVPVMQEAGRDPSEVDMTGREMAQKAREYAATVADEEAASRREREAQSDVARIRKAIDLIEMKLQECVGANIPMRLIRIDARYSLLIQAGKKPVMLPVEMDS